MQSNCTCGATKSTGAVVDALKIAEERAAYDYKMKAVAGAGCSMGANADAACSMPKQPVHAEIGGLHARLDLLSHVFSLVEDRCKYISSPQPLSDCSKGNVPPPARSEHAEAIAWATRRVDELIGRVDVLLCHLEV